VLHALYQLSSYWFVGFAAVTRFYRVKRLSAADHVLVRPAEFSGSPEIVPLQTRQLVRHASVLLRARLFPLSLREPHTSSVSAAGARPSVFARGSLDKGVVVPVTSSEVMTLEACGPIRLSAAVAQLRVSTLVLRPFVSAPGTEHTPRVR
jgi:hypothetical protein